MKKSSTLMTAALLTILSSATMAATTVSSIPVAAPTQSIVQPAQGVAKQAPELRHVEFHEHTGGPEGHRPEGHRPPPDGELKAKLEKFFDANPKLKAERDALKRDREALRGREVALHEQVREGLRKEGIELPPPPQGRWEGRRD